MYRENKDHSHTDSNSRYIQCIRRETRTTVIPILMFTVFRVFDGKRWPLSNRLYLCSVYPIGSEDHCHTDSNSHCIQRIRWEKGTTILLTNSHCFQCYSMRNEDHFHTDTNSHCIQRIGITRTTHILIQILIVLNVCEDKKKKKKKKRTTLILILIVTVFSVTDGKRGLLSNRF